MIYCQQGHGVFGHLNLEDTDDVAHQNALKRRLACHLAQLIQVVLLNCRPPAPAQSRWTGVPAVARFCYGLFAWHRIFVPLFATLHPSAAKGKGKGKGRGRGRGRGRGTRDCGEVGGSDDDGAYPVAAADADVLTLVEQRISVPFIVYSRIKNHGSVTWVTLNWRRLFVLHRHLQQIQRCSNNKFNDGVDCL